MMTGTPIDLEFLDETCDNDATFRAELMEGYLTETRRALFEIENACDEQGGYRQINVAAHSIRGSSGRVGARGLEDAALVLENLSRERLLQDEVDISGASLLKPNFKPHLELIKIEFEKVERFWRQEVQGLSKSDC